MTRITLLTLSLVAATTCSRKPIQRPGVDSGAAGSPFDATFDGQAERPSGGDGQDASDAERPVLAGMIQGYDVALTPSEGLAVVGRLEGSVDLGSGALVSAGGSDLFLGAFARAGATVWNRRFGDAGSQGGGRIASDAAGNLFVAASFSGAMDVGGGVLTSAGGGDVCLARFDAAGRHLWSKRFGNQFHQEAWGAAIDSSGRSVAAITSQGPFDPGGAAPDGGTANPNVGSSSVAMFDPAGNLLWSKTWPGAQILSLAVNPADEVLVAGSFAGTVDFGGGALASVGDPDVFVVVLGPDGGHRWSKRFGGTGQSAALSIAADGGRNLFITGTFDDSLSFGGPTLVSAPDPNLFSPSRDVFVAKLDAAGNHVWSLRFGDTRYDQSGSSITADAAGNVFFAGFLEGTTDFGRGTISSPAGTTGAFLVKLAPAGTTLWSQALEGTAIRVRATPNGGVLLAGDFPAGRLPGAPVRTFVGGSTVFLVEYPP